MSDFEKLLNEQEEIKVGDIVEVEVVQIEDKQLVVSLPNGLQAALPVNELTRERDVEISTLASIGDKIEVLVSKEVVGNAKDEGFSFIVSKNRLEARKAWDNLTAKEGDVVEVTVTRVVRGGLTVDFKGLRGFIPASLVENRFVSDFSKYNGQTFNAKIVELDPAETKLILNRKDVISEEATARKAELYGSIHEGDVVEGTVARLTDWGAFINLGGVDGLVHISEISHAHIKRPDDVLKVGEVVHAEVLNVDATEGRISLSIKATQPGPWSELEDKAPIGSEVDGLVKRLTTFGAFVEIFPGVEGLVHISQISHNHINAPQEVLTEGETVKVKVLDIDPDARRVSLSIKALVEAPANAQSDDEYDGDYELPENETGFSLGDVAGLSDFTEESE
jgi:small subunit ribosomal protein S1